MKHLRLDSDSLSAFERAISSMAEFKKVFDRPLQESFVAELYAARELNLGVNLVSTEPGHDAVGADGKRYQIKYRSETTGNVDVNNFDFDYLILVNLDNNYQLVGMWRMSREQAEKAFVWREKFRKFQCAQKKLKSLAETIR